MSKKIKELPIIALRGLVAFPKLSISFDLSRDFSINALESAMQNGQLIFATAQNNQSEERISSDNLSKVGTLIKIKQVLKLPINIVRVIAEGISRGFLEEIVSEDKFFVGKISINEDELDLKDEEYILREEALVKLTQDAFETYAALGKAAPDFIMEVLSTDYAGRLADLIAWKIPFKVSEKQRVLEQEDACVRLELVLKYLKKEIELLKIQNDIKEKVRAKIDKHQRDYFLKEQIKVIREELGDKEGIESEIEAYEEKMKKLKMPKYAEERLKKELERLKRITQSSAEGTVSRDFIELILELPWGKTTKERKDLKKAVEILNKDHYGIEKVKERIIEFLAVRQASNELNAPVICLVGPPGVGKTSIAKSAAKALNRKYGRISLGGVGDESEIRGHRKTYVGAMPGRIITCIKQVGTSNPLILFDEIDKMRKDYKGDPASALLEVLDGEQNHSFRDNYLEIPYDLSDVLFMCTANSLEDIPNPLRDRLEIIKLDSYTHEEKLRIAQKYLIGKQMKKHGIKKTYLKINKSAISKIITYYTRESGVRQLERLIGQICRKAVKAMLTDGAESISVTEKNLFDFLGRKKYKEDTLEKKNQIGVVRGLAWTSVGGDTLNVEANVMKGSGKFEITGNTGNVMNESAKAAISFIRANSKALNIDVNFYEENDIHIHIPEGAVPKDGPSAGITMATAMVSALTKTPVRNDTAMTGEITIRGLVLPIGGLKEKVLAAKRIGIKRIIIPYDNKEDLEELPDYAKEKIEFILAEDITEVLKNALC